MFGNEGTMKKITLWIALIALALVNQPSLARDCGFQNGEDRWVIKTTVPNGALDQRVQEINLESLIDSTNPTLSKQQKNAIADRRWSGRLAVSDKAGDHASLKEGADSSLKGNTISPHWKGWCDGRRLHTTDGCGAGEDRAWTT
jgi:hypothetical protein